ncbi:MAG TPA: hypothetical protein VGD71_16710 [Kribbella sp.]
MAKSSLPLPVGNGGAKKFLGLVVLVVVLVLVVKYPSDAATWVTSAVDTAGDVISGLVTFVRYLSN